MSRLDNSLRNVTYNLIGILVSYLFTFISRRVFLTYLSIQYLGLDSLFMNLMSMLSLADLGIGTAIAYSLYRPLATNDVEKISALMGFFKKAYIIIGTTIFVFGFSLTPLLPSIFKELPEVPNLNYIYWLYVIHASISYYLSYKRTLLIADQKRYIEAFYQYLFLSIKHLIQILVIILTQNFIFFLIVMIVMTTLENVSISLKVNSHYPYLKKHGRLSLEKNEQSIVKKNMYAISLQKIGTFLVEGTDNLLIVMFVNLNTAGLYANYLLVKRALNRLYQILFSSIIASIGNLYEEKPVEASRLAFFQLNFIAAWIMGLSAITLQLVLNPFISIWIGREYIFKNLIVFVIVFNYYLKGMRQPVLTFRDSLGLFWFDRYKSLFEAFVNLTVSIILVRRIGFIGILIGTTVSTLSVCAWVEPFILFKHGLYLPLSTYFKKTSKYVAVTALAGIVTFFIIQVFSFQIMIVDFFYRLFICLIIPNVIYILLYRKSSEYTHTKYLMKKIIKKFILPILQKKK